mmetsp:Transcript_13118/g.15868  ORF Transcript_13118/g.15868 Transcript_13118/m.15868 type:complete len:296 (-) Transcript_13118:356-1243(-)|eukprot:CAMPEP_0197853874 /NCGR_PEP_ID=MMETSP1438-20131217/23578_1 /TAXON_ID=1461541 /ORGANISM="Pterosperma sp., Strain CCMP1384" /LENGTH=295 /DNA_ID=CAMNT_0043468433 /DNA_START=223 /DNA_END=1110 /DNA_ORIENTATION=+
MRPPLAKAAIFWKLVLCLLALIAGTKGSFVDYDEDDDYETFSRDDVKPNQKTKGAEANSKTAVGRTGTDGGSQEVSFTLEHALGPSGTFTPAGTFSAKAQFHPQTKAVRLTQLRILRDPLESGEKEVFNSLLESGSPYRVRIPSTPFETEEGSKHVMASLPARCLANGGFHENFVLHLDDYANILSVEYSLPASGECQPGEHAEPPTSWKFHTMAYVKLPKEAPRLNADVATHYHTPTRDGAPPTDGPEMSDPNNPKKPPKTFFQKYWMYIVPVGFVLLNNIVAPPEPPAKAKRS